MGGSSHQPREPEAQGQYRGGVPERLTQSQGMDFPIIGCRCPFITRMAQWGFSRKRFSIQPNWCNHLHFPLRAASQRCSTAASWPEGAAWTSLQGQCPECLWSGGRDSPSRRGPSPHHSLPRTSWLWGRNDGPVSYFLSKPHPGYWPRLCLPCVGSQAPLAWPPHSWLQGSAQVSQLREAAEPRGLPCVTQRAGGRAGLERDLELFPQLQKRRQKSCLSSHRGCGAEQGLGGGGPWQAPPPAQAACLGFDRKI